MVFTVRAGVSELGAAQDLTHRLAVKYNAWLVSTLLIILYTGIA